MDVWFWITCVRRNGEKVNIGNTNRLPISFLFCDLSFSPIKNYIEKNLLLGDQVLSFYTQGSD